MNSDAALFHCFFRPASDEELVAQQWVHYVALPLQRLDGGGVSRVLHLPAK